MKDTVALGIAGIAVSGVVGPWLAYRFARNSQAASFLHEREMADRLELRKLLDEAAIVLHNASYARGAAEAALWQGGGNIGKLFPEVAPDLTKAGRPIDEMRERLAVRLGRAHPASAAFSEADEAYFELYKTISYLARFGDDETRADLRNDHERAKAASETFETARERFVEAAVATAGVSLKVSD